MQTWLICVVIGGVVEKRFEAEVQPALSLPRNLGVVEISRRQKPLPNNNNSKFKVLVK